MWWPAFQRQCAKYGVIVPDDISKLAVETFRRSRGKVVQLWKDFETAARSAIEMPNKWFKAGPHCSFATTRNAGFKYLVLKLPSGRKIVYPDVKIETLKTEVEDVDPDTGVTVVKTKFTSAITFYGQIKDKKWGRISTYGGKLVENATQGCAADVMANGACKAEARGHMISTLIHDQALGFELPGLTIDDFLEALCDLPEWAKGLPIAAEGSIVPFYTKD
jgi:DNA polymerase